MIIGVTGFLGSGKGEIAKRLSENYGFEVLSFGDTVRAEADRLNFSKEDPNYRGRLQKLGDSRRQEFGGRYWVDKLLEQVVTGKDYVIEGIRNPEEMEAIREQENFTNERSLIIGINAPIKMRYARVKKRLIEGGRAEDLVTFEQFKIDDRNDRNGKPGEGQQSQICYDFADHYIDNAGTLEELHKKIDFFMDEAKC